MKHQKTELVRGEHPANPSRRQFLKNTAAAALVAAAGPASLTRYAHAAARPVKIGLVTPASGPLAIFAEPDEFVLSAVRKLVANGLTINGANHPIQILVRDSRSDPNRAAEVASALIKSDKVDLIIAGDTPEVMNPVADQAEINAVPCVTSGCPWQVFFFGRGGKLPQGFDWTYHFFWGIEDLFACYTNLWNSIPTSRVVGALWPNDNDGNATSDPQHGEPPYLAQKGFKLVDPGRFDTMTNDFSAMISKFKQGNVDIVTGVIPPPAFATFWSQAAQQGFRPKIVTVAKAALFPAAVTSYGERGISLTTEVWWSPFHPFKSSLTGQTSAQLCAQWEKESKKQWTAEVGFKHAMFEVALDVLKRTKNIDSPAAIRDAIRETKLDTIAGHIEFGITNKNVSKTPLVGGQWVKGKHFKYDLVVVNNETFKAIPTQAQLKAISYP
jgi:branched-chain amino acid transport system substrate-binding protein